MTEYIIKFNKDDKVKYVSHLDIVRVFERSFRRSEINLSYSNGFNPHPIMSFAHPLGVGISSLCELMLVSLDDDLSPKELALRLNEHLPQGFKVIAAKVTSSKSPFKDLSFARYKIKLMGNFQNDIINILTSDRIIMPKRTKKGIKEVDIKPLIKRLDILETSHDKITLNAVLSCGSENLKPDLLICAIEKLEGTAISDYSILRTDLLNETLAPIIEF